MNNSIHKEMYDLDYMIENHINKGKKMEAMLNGGPILQPVGHKDCVLGKWYYGAGKKWNHLPEYKNLEEPHKKIHLLMSEIYELYKKQEIELAQRKMQEWQLISRELQKRINFFKQNISFNDMKN